MLISCICAPLTGASEVVAPLMWDLKDYRFQIEPQRQKEPVEIIPFITATLSKSPEGEVNLFGVVFKDDEADTFWVYEIYDSEANKVIKQISINEMLGTIMNKGCVLLERHAIEKEATVITRYRVSVGKYDLTEILQKSQNSSQNLASTGFKFFCRLL